MDTNILKSKKFRTGEKVNHVVLIKNGNLFTVTVNDEVFYRGYNELFAVQKFNAI